MRVYKASTWRVALLAAGFAACLQVPVGSAQQACPRGPSPPSASQEAACRKCTQDSKQASQREAGLLALATLSAAARGALKGAPEGPGGAALGACAEGGWVLAPGLVALYSKDVWGGSDCASVCRPWNDYLKALARYRQELEAWLKTSRRAPK
jgi:hypothetical protein